MIPSRVIVKFDKMAVSVVFISSKPNSTKTIFGLPVWLFLNAAVLLYPFTPLLKTGALTAPKLVTL